MSSRPGRAGLLGAFVGAAAWLAPVAHADVLFLRDGSQRAGALSACVGETCGFSGDSVPRAAIAAIAFGDVTTPPPAPTQIATDEVHLAGGAVMVSAVVGISLGVVATESGSHDRDQVDWVLFALPSPGRSEGPPVVLPTPPPTPTPVPTRTPTPTPSPTPRPAPSPTPPPPPPPGGTRGALWTGRIVGRNFGTVDDTTSDWQYEIDVRLREYSVPLYCPVFDADGRPVRSERVGSHVVLVSEGSRLTNHFSSINPYDACRGDAEIVVAQRGAGSADGSGALWTKRAERDLTPCLGVDFPRGETLYLVGLGAPNDAGFDVQCLKGNPMRLGFVSPVLGWFPTYGAAECSDGEIRLAEGGGRILRGAFRRACTGCCPESEVSWSICREGVVCPPPPERPEPPPAPRRPCDETEQERAQLDLLVHQWILLSQVAQRSAAAAEATARDAANLERNFEQAMRDCNLWGFGQILAGVLASGIASGGAAQGGAQGFYSFTNYASQLDKIASGDPSWLLPSANLELRGQEWLALENYYDQFALAYANLGSAAPQELRQRLQTCGAPTWEDILDDAYAYLRLMEQLGPLADQMHQDQNRLRRLEEQEFIDFCGHHVQACADYLDCRDAPAAP